jgi:hypothetical protein
MWNLPSSKRLKKIPGLYQTEAIAFEDKLIYLHFFIANSNWYVAEYDGGDIFFGYAILNNDIDNAEWGYISFKELRELKVMGWLEVDCDLEKSWPVRKASQITKIRLQEVADEF